ncbi:hypothetical protein [Helicobacter ganmani]|uniref:hypothetical protein n=1 Tax=Helicobacter ganmani TaxID=60246 RepID=UPI003A8750BB
MFWGICIFGDYPHLCARFFNLGCFTFAFFCPCKIPRGIAAIYNAESHLQRFHFVITRFRKESWQ